MTTPKTTRNDADVGAFIDAVGDETKRHDSRAVIRMMQQATGARPRMWGSSIVGFGRYRFKYDSGREGEWMLCGFSPRKQSLVLYIMPGFKSYDNLLKKLGKHSTGKSCLYIRRLVDVDQAVLQELIDRSVAQMRDKHETSP